MTKLQIERWQLPQQKQVNHFYKTHNQNVSCHKRDIIFTVQDPKAQQSKSQIIAAVFIRHLTTEQDELNLLRSLFVAPEYRNNKVASQLLNYVMQNTTSRLTTICEPNLVPLYLSAGFNICEHPNQSKYLAKFIQQGKVVLTRESC
jgi:GNAT superfamily N-acetyltransferase